MRRAVLAAVVALAVLGDGCAVFQFGRSSLPLDRLRLGMTKEQVTQALGGPAGIQRNWAGQGDLREVWVYHVFRRFNQDTPLYPDTHTVIFRNDKVVGWDMPNPYRPDLLEQK